MFVVSWQLLRLGVQTFYTFYGYGLLALYCDDAVFRFWVQYLLTPLLTIFGRIRIAKAIPYVPSSSIIRLLDVSDDLIRFALPEMCRLW